MQLAATIPLHARPCSTPVLQGPCNFHLWAKPPTDEHPGQSTHLSAMKTESTTDSCLGMRWYVMHVVRPPADTTSARASFTCLRAQRSTCQPWYKVLATCLAKQVIIADVGACR